MLVAPITYFYPGVKWDPVLARRTGPVLINPASGPGTAASLTYVGHVGRCHAAGVKVLGYVHTKYGARPIAEVKADVDRHFSWYGVDGIFVDTTSNKLADVGYYADLSEYIRTRGGLVVLNPGTRTIEPYAGLCDWLMNAETDAVTYRTRVASAWEHKYPGKFWHVVHTCAAADMPLMVQLAAERDAGLVCVTDDVMPNPYDALPSYFTALYAAVAEAG